jgi:sugar phosphate isomerase/epimerase
MAEILADLWDAGYSGPLTLEIDDLNFPKSLSAEEKIAVLKRDLGFMRECME